MTHSQIRSHQDLESLRDRLATERSGKRRVLVCSTGCLAIGARDIESAFRAEVDKAGMEDEVEVVRTGCHGLCAMAPVVVIEPNDIVYGRNRVKYVPDVFQQTVLGDEVIRRFCFGRDADLAHTEDIPFYAHQTKQVLRNVGRVDPLEIDSAIERGVYQAAARVLTDMEPGAVLDEVSISGLRGRGGAGFPTGLKWEICKNSPGASRYLICNADEGDPGAFMDRALLEGDPHSVLEGMIIAGYAIGAKKGFIYVRNEYPIAVRHLRRAVNQAVERGLLGADVLGSGYSFDIEVREGAGAFVCGEETALIASLEGERGMPRPKPPYPALRGYRSDPTVINNVETFANVPLVLDAGGEEFARNGTEGSKGTKIFALAGQVNNTGLVEVPMGATIRDIIFGVGGGMPRNREFKAVQMGGPSGGCVPASHLDLPIDYDSLREVGAIMGSGGMVVMDNTTCIVDIARFFVSFCADESCGVCAPCRLGTVRLAEILDRICEGSGSPADLDALEDLSEVVQKTSLCGLGQTAPNPVLSTLRHFREEYLAHVVDKTCPADVCDALRPVPVTTGGEQ